MHPRLEERIETVLKEREQALCESIAALATAIDGGGGVPPILVGALRELAAALALCSRDERGRRLQLRLLVAALPVLENVMHLLAARYRSEAALLLGAISELTKGVEAVRVPGASRGRR